MTFLFVCLKFRNKNMFVHILYILLKYVLSTNKDKVAKNTLKVLHIISTQILNAITKNIKPNLIKVEGIKKVIHI